MIADKVSKIRVFESDGDLVWFNPTSPVCSTKSKEKVRLNGLTFSFDYVGYIYEHFWQNRLVMIELHMNTIKLLLDVIMVTDYEEA